MKRQLAAIALALYATVCSAQLKGSGTTVTKTFDYTHFDKIHFEDLDGNLEVELGKPFGIQITIDDNLEPMLSVSEDAQEHLLKIRFDNNENNRKYIENSNLRIRISMPELSVIKNIGNSNLEVTKITGRYFRITNKGNGNIQLSGNIDQLEVEKTGNGDVIAKSLTVKSATVTSVGNGNVWVNVNESLTANSQGNGDIKNTGAAPFDSKSHKTGNGNLIKQ